LVGAIAGMLACVASLNTSKKEKPFKESFKFVRWVRFQSECGKYNVDFNENDSHYVESVRTGRDTISHHDITFKFKEEYMETIYLDKQKI